MLKFIKKNILYIVSTVFILSYGVQIFATETENIKEETENITAETKVNNNDIINENNKNKDNEKDNIKLPPIDNNLKEIQNKIIEQSQEQEKKEKEEQEKKIEEQKNQIIEEIKKEETENITTETKVNNNDIINENNKNKDNEKDNDVITNKNQNKDSKKNITNKKEDKKNNIDIDKIFTKFDKKKALDFDYNKIKYNNFMLLENNEELKEIKQAIKEQGDINFMKKKEKEEKNYKNKNEENMSFVQKIEDTIRISSLVYFNDQDWKAKINGKYVNNKNKDKLTIKDTNIIKVNKISIIFLMKKPDNKIENIKKIQKEGGSYSNNYYLIKEGKKTYIAFKLFIGQTINLETMKITG